MWAGFEDKGLLIENSDWYRMINDFSLSPDICTHISPVLQKNLGSRNKQEKLSVWSIGKKEECWFVVLVLHPAALPLKLEQTGIDTEGIWSVIVYKIKGAECKASLFSFFKWVHGVRRPWYFLQGFCCANNIIKAIDIFEV